MLTFVNKLDLPSRDPFELLDEIERDLQIHAAPVNWPIGDGDRFKGVYDLRRNQVLLYERSEHNARRAGIEVANIDDPALRDLIGDDAAAHLREAAALVAEAGTQVDPAAYLRAEQTPVFFGSALSNFGLEPFLRGLTELAPPPQPRPSSAGPVDPADPDFSGFVFKIQANMNPRHRDRIAFVRVCSGVLSKDMQVTNARLNAPIRLSRPNRFFGRERETVESAVAGDVVGLVNPGRFAIGDTLYAGKKLAYPPIPHFAAEHFGAARLRDVRFKQFDDGIRQLEEEGLMQVVFPTLGRREPILGVVGALQFDVVAARLKSEYGVDADIDRLKYTMARWVVWPGGQEGSLTLPTLGVLQAVDRDDRQVLLFESNWELQYCERENPKAKFVATSSAVS
jgi:peptide chain release factor 3